ncbi:HAD-IA family hydrolase [Methylomicrobium sp. Wu6]|uniref:HAD family hydrolase n=1 Tax=Methylomicrobium sp. Wu6 TaxID=3107928 RepID=UPI002DD67EE1|nr:HAD-IA family hydrolase [Methylomicrobium sp. Wu6]MEC4749462.1 HAD-IA family hydrolase [Methylomicrobium sp. Wu6]
MKNRFDLLIFDWDGTLMDSIGWIVHCMQTAAGQLGCPIPTPEAAKDVIGLSIIRAMDTLFPDAGPELREQLVRRYSQEYASRHLGPDDLFAGVREMLEELNGAGYRLAVATGKTRAGLQKALQATGTEELFCITRAADETASKPDPLMLLEIISQVDVAPERALMIGDSIHDLQMAQNAQISAIGVCCGAHSEEILQQYRPLLCLQQPAELLTII